jgi:large subunit ribosomal protein L24
VDQLVPLSVGKVMLVCPHCNKPARVGYRMDNDTKERFCKNCGQGLVTEGAES